MRLRLATISGWGLVLFMLYIALCMAGHDYFTHVMAERKARVEAVAGDCQYHGYLRHLDEKEECQ